MAKARSNRQSSPSKDNRTVYTIAVVLVAFWLLGMFGSYRLGGLIHVLLVIAVVVVVLRLIQGRRVL